MAGPGRRLLTRGLPIVVAACLWAVPGAAQTRPLHHGFWADVAFGYGRLAMSSDQEPRSRREVFTLNFAVGGWLGPRLRLGAELNGWLLEAFDPNDPSIGESVSQARVLAQVYPFGGRRFFLKAALGQASYTNEHPLAFDSHGWGGSVGAGYDIRLGRNFSLTPVVSLGRGSLGGVSNLVTTVSNRRYDVIDAAVAFTWR